MEAILRMIMKNNWNDKKKYYAKTNILEQTPEQAQYHLDKAAEKRRRKELARLKQKLSYLQV